MTKTLAITAIVLVAVVMGLSTIAPALQQAFAHDVDRVVGGAVPLTTCPPNFEKQSHPIRTHPDHNANGKVCVKDLPNGKTVIIDDIAVRR